MRRYLAAGPLGDPELTSQQQELACHSMHRLFFWHWWAHTAREEGRSFVARLPFTSMPRAFQPSLRGGNSFPVPDLKVSQPA